MLNHPKVLWSADWSAGHKKYNVVNFWQLVKIRGTGRVVSWHTALTSAHMLWVTRPSAHDYQEKFRKFHKDRYVGNFDIARHSLSSPRLCRTNLPYYNNVVAWCFEPSTLHVVITLNIGDDVLRTVFGGMFQAEISLETGYPIPRKIIFPQNVGVLKPKLEEWLHVICRSS